jgi:hypothetical protein
MTVLQWHSLHQPLALACALAVFFPNTVNVQAQSAFSSSSQISKPQPSPPNPKYNNRLRKVARLKFTLPPKGAPGRRTDAASRSGCPVLSQPVTALVPPTNIGLTLAERPTFWFNIPYQPNSNNLRKFQLLDEEETVVYETFPVVEASGIVNISLPNSLPALQIGKKYQWVLSFICDPASLDTSAWVNGYVERVAVTPQLKQKLETAKTLREQILLYAENGLWFDTLTALITELRNKPTDAQLVTDWQDLLQSLEVQLPELANKPVLSYNKTKE